MASPPSSTAVPAAVSSSPEEERKGEQDMMHKIKVIQFLGRTTPIVLQNDNGPCPLLAICNVLLLKNNLTLSPDVPEVSQQRLLSLVADRIFESNLNIDDKDAGYVENQQQNIADAIDLLPRLTTGIDVNIKFKRIGDFEFTRECAIFDLLDIPLYHGWVVDPQDFDTANAIGAKSYNTLMGDLVALEARNLETEKKKTSEDDSVDFAAATTATLGVPSPCLSRGRSFEDPPISLPDHHKARRGDIEEEEKLSRVLILSKSEVHISSADDSAPVRPGSFTVTDGSLDITNSESVSSVRELKSSCLDESQRLCSDAVLISDTCEALNDLNLYPNGSETVLQEAACLSPMIEQETSFIKSNLKESESSAVLKVVKEDDVDLFLDMKSVPYVSSRQSPLYDSKVHIRGEHEDHKNLPDSASELHAEYRQNGHDPCLSTHTADTDPFNGKRPRMDEHECFTATVDSCEPIYEGEDSIMESTATIHENREPVYEGEVVIAEQGSGNAEGSDTKKDQITPKEGELIRNFLRNSASQLTIYGLFCLQEGLKERELCVFFRNNHFNTMFKFEGELYILATDLGYLNQPDLVWEKLNEVNGDTLYMTANFKEFKMEDHGNNSWDEQNAMTSTADYLTSIDNSTQEDFSFNSDLQLAIALQQQEFEQQATQQHNSSRQPSVGSGRLVTGPQVSKNSGKYASSSSKQESKSVKEKCVIM